MKLRIARKVIGRLEAARDAHRAAEWAELSSPFATVEEWLRIRYPRRPRYGAQTQQRALTLFYRWQQRQIERWEQELLAKCHCCSECSMELVCEDVAQGGACRRRCRCDDRYGEPVDYDDGVYDDWEAL